jgi:hypothetical protein
MHITTSVVSSNPAQGDVYSIQHYVIKFVSDLRQVGGFLRVLWFSPPIKLTPQYNWNIVESDVKHHKPNPLIKQLWNITNVISTRKEAMMFEIRNILFPFPILDNNIKIDKTYIFVSDTIQCYLYNNGIQI